jgi:uncharacterized membrane protein HdeD (DUF308 family)
MTLLSTNTEIIKKFGKYSIFTGLILIIIGIAGAVVPNMMALEMSMFVAFFMLVGGLSWGIHTFQYARHSVTDWLKPLLLIVVGGLVLYSPEQSVATLGLFLAFYLMMDAFSSFSIAQAHYPSKGWGWMVVNGIVSVLLSVLFLTGWPQSSFFLVGLFIAISLFFDGLALVILGLTAKNI